ncbi:hypothetical protein PCASD_16440 [Puccinia coronata f. sp. avenae]|uniref:Mediator of RNA polymerase II transcription subunit 6 n=1 Tax=Puccinia coronata f. sp. avenae TaxID=200324 RepID=A0A2N5U3M7_9BASI|nr:hypothetical protein PCASD_16440 [Puccinia coronata f. sp. avenae]
MNSTIAGLAIPAESDLCHVQWRSMAWILEHGPLTETNVMDYFSLSPFYDRKSTNQVLRMQSMFSGQPKMDPLAEQEALKRLIGVQYAVVLARPEPDREGGLFIIEKRIRKADDQYYPIASYYVLKTSIYQAPSLYATLSSRVLTSLSSLKQLLDLARQHKPTYDPRQSYAWKIKEKVETTHEQDATEDQVPPDPATVPDPSSSTHDSDKMDMDAPSSPKKDNDHDAPANTTAPSARQSNKHTPELANPILFRALQNTLNNFAAFKPPKPQELVPERVPIPASSAPSPP